MTTKCKVAINGFGRIGRLVYRIISHSDTFTVCAINDLVPVDNLAYLLKYDTVHGRFPEEVSVSGGEICVGDQRTKVFSETDPAALPWKELGVDYVVEATGIFNRAEDAAKHIEAGAKRVVLSAPAKDEVPTYVMGVNHHLYKPERDTVVSNASCTTNCLAPIAKVLLRSFGIQEALMTTVHAVTASQPTVDGPSKKDWRAGRAAGYNIIPASTGAAKAVGLCLPELQGKLTGMALRVPLVDVSAVDLTVKLSTPTSYEKICEVLKEASQTDLKGILGYCDEQVVSSDFVGSTFSSVFDKGAGIALNETFYKIIAWYDNEMGYAARVVDLLGHLLSQEHRSN